MRATVKYEAAYPRAAVAQRRQVAALLGPLGAAAVLGPEPAIGCMVTQPTSRGTLLPSSRCSGCGRRSGDVKRCSRCKTAVYCSLEWWVKLHMLVRRAVRLHTGRPQRLALLKQPRRACSAGPFCR